MDCQIKCLGRRAPGIPALREPVDAVVHIRQAGNSISLDVNCIYNTGGHGQRCKASHPNVDKVGDGVFCAYAVDIPWHHDHTLVGPRP